jgi:diaminohydroxyphosphoribosylaminopyrimidine deaminase/5-amino-6-(5-phosphoribosylamino)uracil reductase
VSSAADRAALYSAYEQAIFAAGNSDPNPAVGATIVDRQGNTLSSGYTQRAGFAHAERQALAQVADRDLRDCTMYVTLEPCCHHGRTPPCVDAIVERGLRRVVIAERDFAAEVQGRSVAMLRDNGIEVLEWPAEDFRREKWFTTGPFFFARNFRRPRIVLKWAQTADGSLAPQRGKSGPISGSDAAFVTAVLRFWCKLTAASPGTVLVDAPRLTVRPSESAPDLSRSGLSAFVWELMRTQYNLAVTAHSAETLTRTVRAAESLHLVPDTLQGVLQGMSSAVTAARGGWWIKPVPHADWQHDFAGTLDSVLTEVLDKGFNSMLFEAGPQFSEQLLAHGYADALAIYRSRTQHDVALWGAQGRGNRISALLAGEKKPDLPGFTLLEYASLDSDDFLLYVRNGTF